MKPALVVRTEGHELGLTMTPEEAGALLGLSDEAIRGQCRQGVLPTMPRAELPGASWRIPTVRLLTELGLTYEIVEASASSKSSPGARGPAAGAPSLTASARRRTPTEPPDDPGFVRDGAGRRESSDSAGIGAAS